MDEAEEKLIMTQEDETKNEIQPVERKFGYFGVFLLLVSAFFYSLSALLVKIMAKIDPMENLMFRYLGLFFFSLPILIYKKVPLFPSSLKQNVYLCLLSFEGVAVGVFSFIAFRNLPLGDASSLCFSAPVFVALFSLIFRVEKSNLFTWLLLSLSFLGVFLISKPESMFGAGENHSYEFWGVVSGVSSAIFRAVRFMSFRLLNDTHYSVIICHFGMTGIVCLICYFFISGTFIIPDPLLSRISLILSAILGFLGQVCLTKASKLESATTISICRSMDILFTFLYQIVIFNQIPDVFSVSGAVSIILSVVLLKWKPKNK